MADSRAQLEIAALGVEMASLFGDGARMHR